MGAKQGREQSEETGYANVAMDLWRNINSQSPNVLLEGNSCTDKIVAANNASLAGLCTGLCLSTLGR